MEEFKERQVIQQRLCLIKHKILVMSGKGGVGKSTVATNLAVTLVQQGNKVGLMDVDVHGPNIPKMLGLEGRPIAGTEGNLQPVIHSSNLKVMSMAFFLRQDSDAVIWRGPLKGVLIKQFIKDVDWGKLDYLIIDAPPGTGDEPLSVAQLIEDADGAIIVTTPQEVALLDIRKSITFCRQINMKILGIVENMSGLACPHCHQNIDLFKSGGGARVAKEMNVPFLGSIPIDAKVVESGDNGLPIVADQPNCPVSKAYQEIVNKVIGK
jgi:Mrp family chromosome partitioning ATPase